jgi:hypothetical protein
MPVITDLAECKKRVANQLARAVIGDIAPSINPVHLHSTSV